MYNNPIHLQKLRDLQNSVDFSQMFLHKNGVDNNYYFYALFKQIPSTISVEDLDQTDLMKGLNELYPLDDLQLYKSLDYDNEKNTTKQGSGVYLLDEGLMLSTYIHPNGIDLTLYYAPEMIPQSRIDEIVAIYKNCKSVAEEEKMHILTQRGGNLNFTPFKLKPVPIELEKHYNDDFPAVHQVIIDRLSTEDDKGLVILYGKPGTGKTSYIRYLCSQIQKQKLFITPDTAQEIARPDFISLLFNYKNSILVIEDAENIIQERKGNGTSAISNLLNLTDGMLADCFNIQVICTFNSDVSMIDKALLRKGRLIAKYEFKDLEPAKAQALLLEQGIDVTVKEPMAITEVFNYSEMDFEDKKRKIGF